MWTIFKVFIEFVTILLLFCILVFFGLKACGNLAPQPGIEPTASALEGKLLTTGSPGKSQENMHFLEFPRWPSGKESARKCKRHGFDPWVGKIP